MVLEKPNPLLTPLTPLGKGGIRGSRKVLSRGYGVHTSPDQPRNSALRPPSPPMLGGTGVQSPPELGDLGGEKDLCVHGSLLGEGSFLGEVSPCQSLLPHGRMMARVG
jgi:hypothetical protein